MPARSGWACDDLEIERLTEMLISYVRKTSRSFCTFGSSTNSRTIQVSLSSQCPGTGITVTLHAVRHHRTGKHGTCERILPNYAQKEFRREWGNVAVLSEYRTSTKRTCTAHPALERAGTSRNSEPRPSIFARIRTYGLHYVCATVYVRAVVSDGHGMALRVLRELQCHIVSVRCRGVLARNGLAPA